MDCRCFKKFIVLNIYIHVVHLSAAAINEIRDVQVILVVRVLVVVHNSKRLPTIKNFFKYNQIFIEKV